MYINCFVTPYLIELITTTKQMYSCKGALGMEYGSLKYTVMITIRLAVCHVMSDVKWQHTTAIQTFDSCDKH